MSNQEALTVEAGSCWLVHQNLQKMTELLGNYSSVLKNVEVLLQQINSKMETSDEKIDFNKQSPVMSLSSQATSSPDTKQSSKEDLQPNEGKPVAQVDSESDAFEIFQRQLQSDSDPCSEDDQSDGSSQEPTATSTPKKSTESDKNKVAFESDEAVTVPLTDEVPVPSHVKQNRKNDLQWPSDGFLIHFHHFRNLLLQLREDIRPWLWKVHAASQGHHLSTLQMPLRKAVQEEVNIDRSQVDPF